MVVLGEVSERGGGERARQREEQMPFIRPYRFNYIFCGDSRNIYKVILKVTRAIQLKDIDNINL